MTSLIERKQFSRLWYLDHWYLASRPSVCTDLYSYLWGVSELQPSGVDHRFRDCGDGARLLSLLFAILLVACYEHSAAIVME